MACGPDLSGRRTLLYVHGSGLDGRHLGHWECMLAVAGSGASGQGKQ